MMAIPTRNGAAGFSLIELLVSLTLSLLLMAALGAIFAGVSRSYREDDRQTRLQEELRFALSQLTADLEMAGFWGSGSDPARIELDSSLAALAASAGGLGCEAGAGDDSSLQPAVQALDNASTVAVETRFPCLSPADRQPGTDLIAIKRLRGAPADSVPAGQADRRSALTAGHVYLQEDGRRAVLFVQPARSSRASAPSAERALTPPLRYWEYVPALYYVRPYSVRRGDGLPSLCRKQLTVDAGQPAWRSECLAQGVEDLQLEYGIDDRRLRADGVADYHLSQPQPDQLPAVAQVRILLRVRAQDPDRGYRNAKRYRLSNSTVDSTPDDRYHRRTLATSVLLRNVGALGAGR